MQISVILAHPRPGSFNHAIASAAAEALLNARRTVNFHDLYAEKFDPLLTADELGSEPPTSPQVRAHTREITSADGIVIVHPNWWAQPPAILKGWVDRVIRQGIAYEFRAEGPVGLLKAKAAVVFNTSNTPLDQEMTLYGDPLQNLWKTCIFDFCGIKSFVRRNYTSVIMSTPQQRAAWLADVRDVVASAFAEK